MNKLTWVVVAALVVVLIGVVVLLMNLNSIVRAGVEKASTASLGLETTVGSAQVSLLGGAVGLNSMQVASPKGFTAPNFLDVGRIGLEVGYSELRKDPIRLGNLTVEKPKLVIEQAGGKFNLKAVMDTIPPSDPNSTPPNLIIGTIAVKGAQVVIRPGIPGLSQEVTVPLPDITVREVGTGPGAQNGVAIREALLVVAAEMARSAANSDKLPPEVRALLQADLGNLREQIGKILQQVTDQARQQVDQAAGEVRDAAGKAAEDAQKAVQQGLGGLLNQNRRP